MDFFIRKGNFQGLTCSRNKLFSHGQNILSKTKSFCHGQYFFVWDKIDFVWDKKYFVPAEGTGISCQNRTNFQSTKCQYAKNAKIKAERNGFTF